MMRTIITVALLSFFSSGLMASCDQWLSQYEQIQNRYDKGRSYKAIQQLESLIQRCPDRARLSLELGNFWYRLGYSETAARIWKQVLTDHILPEKVAAMVKLRILQASDADQNRLSQQALVRVGQQWGPQNTNEVTASGSIKYEGQKVPVFGYARQADISSRVTGHLSQNAQSGTDTYLASMTLSSNLGVKPMGIKLGARVQQVDQVAESTFSVEPRLTVSALSIYYPIDYSTDSGLIEFGPELLVRTPVSGRFRVSAVFIEGGDAGQYNGFSEARMAYRWGKTFRPSLALAYSQEQEEVATEAGLTWNATKNWSLNIYTGSEYQFGGVPDPFSSETGASVAWHY